MLTLAVSAAGLAQIPSKRLLNLDDLDRLRYVADPQCSPDGRWVAYTAAQVDKEKDKRITHLWMASWTAARILSLRTEQTRRTRPDNRYLAFMSSREGETKGSQVWLLDRRGGEAGN